MPLELWATIAEIVSSVAIVVTLVYLSVQTRQNTNAMMALSRQAALEAELDLASDWVDHPEFVKYGPFTGEQARYAAWVIKLLRVREFEWHQYQTGILDEASWKSYMKPLPGVFEDETARRVLDWYYGDPDFTAHIYSLLNKNTTRS